MKKPEPNDYAPHLSKYYDLVEEGDLAEILIANHESTQDLLEVIPEVKADYRYASEKWSIKEVLIHAMDTERVINYRALRFARNDSREIDGFDHSLFVKESYCEERSLSSIAEEFLMIRNATISLFGNFNEAVLDRAGVVNGSRITVRAMGYLIAGHEVHHINVIKDKYLSV